MHGISRLFNIAEHKRIVTRNKTLYFNLDYATLIITKQEGGGKFRKEYDASSFIKAERFSTAVELKQSQSLREFYNDINHYQDLSELENFHQLFQAEEKLRYNNSQMAKIIRYKGLEPTDEDAAANTGPVLYNLDVNSKDKKDVPKDKENTGLRVTFQAFGSKIQQLTWFFETAYDREAFLSLLLAASSNGHALSRRFRALDQQNRTDKLTIEQAGALLFDIGISPDDIFNGTIRPPAQDDILTRSASISYATNPALRLLGNKGLLPPPPSLQICATSNSSPPSSPIHGNPTPHLTQTNGVPPPIAPDKIQFTLLQPHKTDRLLRPPPPPANFVSPPSPAYSSQEFEAEMSPQPPVYCLQSDNPEEAKPNQPNINSVSPYPTLPPRPTTQNLSFSRTNSSAPYPPPPPPPGFSAGPPAPPTPNGPPPLKQQPFASMSQNPFILRQQQQQQEAATNAATSPSASSQFNTRSFGSRPGPPSTPISTSPPPQPPLPPQQSVPPSFHPKSPSSPPVPPQLIPPQVSQPPQQPPPLSFRAPPPLGPPSSLSQPSPTSEIPPASSRPPPSIPAQPHVAPPSLSATRSTPLRSPISPSDASGSAIFSFQPPQMPQNPPSHMLSQPPQLPQNPPSHVLSQPPQMPQNPPSHMLSQPPQIPQNPPPQPSSSRPPQIPQNPPPQPTSPRPPQTPAKPPQGIKLDFMYLNEPQTPAKSPSAAFSTCAPFTHQSQNLSQSNNSSSISHNITNESSGGSFNTVGNTSNTPATARPRPNAFQQLNSTKKSTISVDLLPPEIPTSSSNPVSAAPIIPTSTPAHLQREQTHAEKFSIVGSLNKPKQQDFYSGAPDAVFPEDDIPTNLKKHIYHHTLLREFIIYLRTQQFFVSYFNSQTEHDLLDSLTTGTILEEDGGESSVSSLAINTTSPNITPTTLPPAASSYSRASHTTNSNMCPIPLEFSLENIYLIYADIIRLIASVRYTRINGIVITASKSAAGPSAVDSSIKLPTLQHYLSIFESIFENKHIAQLGKRYEEFSHQQTSMDRSRMQQDHRLHAKQLYIQHEYLSLLQNNQPVLSLLIGEELFFTSECGVAIPVYSSSSAQGLQPHQTLVPAKVRFTNYRIIITPHDSLYNTVDIPNYTILKFGYQISNQIGKGSAAYPQDTTIIDIEGKDVRKIRLFVDGVGISGILELVKQHAFGDSTHDAFAFKYKLGLLTSQNSYQLKIASAPGGKLSKLDEQSYTKFQALPINPNSPGYINGWEIFDAEAEYRRQALPLGNKFSLVMNVDYNISPTYPSVLVVPTSCVNNIYEICEHRSRGRFPMVTYYYQLSNATISRCAQPLVGISGKISNHDINLLSEIRRCNTSNDQFYQIFDARPYKAAMANKLGGKGMEKIGHYEKTKLSFLNIDNIHAISASYRKLNEACYPTFIDQADINDQKEEVDNNTYLTQIVESKWLHYISLLLTSAVRVVQLISEEKTSVMIRCSDSWDRTPQICALSMLILDPYYRTLHGFCVLIEKEFCSFGHMFSERCGHGQMNVGSQRSPIFIQFLDCVFQIMHQYPMIFEFTPLLLIHIAESLYSCRYGTFIFNCEQQRTKYELANTTISLWTELLHPTNKKLYLNTSYRPAEMGRIYYPDASGARITLFESLHLRYSPHLKQLLDNIPEHPGSYSPDIQITGR